MRDSPKQINCVLYSMTTQNCWTFSDSPARLNPQKNMIQGESTNDILNRFYFMLDNYKKSEA